tara:strand:- start:1521 stop:2072 length:552 start_codon:yes stop_codon:yes gene_type:complete
MWFNILKNELASKTGFSQLDFDNIVIEDEDDCKKRWQQLCQELEGFTISDTEEYRVVSDKDGVRPYGGMHSTEFMAKDGSSKATLWLHYDYDSEIPEEVYCKALEILFDTSIIGSSNGVKIRDYEIFKTSNVSEIPDKTYNVEFNHYIEIRTSQPYYYDLGFTLLSSDNSLEPIARKLLEILR